MNPDNLKKRPDPLKFTDQDESYLQALIANKNADGIRHYWETHPYQHPQIDHVGKALENGDTDTLLSLLDHPALKEITFRDEPKYYNSFGIKWNGIGNLLNDYLSNCFHLADGNGYNYNAMHYAASYGHANLVCLLVDKFNMDINEKTRPFLDDKYHNIDGHLDGAGMTVIHIAASDDHAECALSLLQKFPILHLDERDEQGFTPLMRTAEWGRDVKTLTTLLAAGACPNLKNNNGENFLQIAEKRPGPFASILKKSLFEQEIPSTSSPPAPRSRM